MLNQIKHFIIFIAEQLFVPSKRIFTFEQIRNFLGFISILTDLTKSNKDDLFVKSLEFTADKAMKKLPKRRRKSIAKKINDDTKFAPSIGLNYDEERGFSAGVNIKLK